MGGSECIVVRPGFLVGRGWEGQPHFGMVGPLFLAVKFWPLVVNHSGLVGCWWVVFEHSFAYFRTFYRIWHGRSLMLRFAVFPQNAHDDQDEKDKDKCSETSHDNYQGI